MSNLLKLTATTNLRGSTACQMPVLVPGDAKTYFRSTEACRGRPEETIWRPELRACTPHLTTMHPQIGITKQITVIMFSCGPTSAQHIVTCMQAAMGRAVTVDRRPEGFAIATIAREPVNSMDLGLWRELLEVLEALEAEEAVRGVIWASGLKRDVFTAGNDLKVASALRHVSVALLVCVLSVEVLRCLVNGLAIPSDLEVICTVWTGSLGLARSAAAEKSPLPRCRSCMPPAQAAPATQTSGSRRPLSWPACGAAR